MDQTDEVRIPVWLGLLGHLIGLVMTLFLVISLFTSDWDTAFYNACVAVPWLMHLYEKNR